MKTTLSILLVSVLISFSACTGNKTSNQNESSDKKEEVNNSLNNKDKKTMALEITDATFEDLLKSDKPVVIDFWAEWCGPCRMVGPIVDELAAEYEGKVTIGKVDVDNNDEIAAKYGIRNIPTILFIKNGEVVDKQVGAVQKAVLQEKVENLLK